VTNPSVEGCHAIRLKACGHVVGYECFRSWLQRVPHRCPYWNLAFTTATTAVSSPWTVGDCVSRALDYVCDSWWFTFQEDTFHDIVIGTRISAREASALDAAADYYMTLAQRVQRAVVLYGHPTQVYCTAQSS
jgi:hypothetical protein